MNYSSSIATALRNRARKWSINALLASHPNGLFVNISSLSGSAQYERAISTLLINNEMHKVV